MAFERDLFVCRHERGLEPRNVDCTSLLAPAIYRLFEPHARYGRVGRAAFEHGFWTSWCAGLRSRSTRCSCVAKCSCGC